MGRRIDYSNLPPFAQATLTAGFMAAAGQGTPREQISCSLALFLGMIGCEPAGIPLGQSDPHRDRFDLIFDECADAVLDVLARHNSTWTEIS